MGDPLWIGLCCWYGFVALVVISWLTVGEIRDRIHAKQTVDKFATFVAEQRPLELTYKKSGEVDV